MKLIAILAAVNTLLLSEAVIANEHQYQANFDGTLKIGKQYSYIFYFGEQSGDTVVYFFETNSAEGKKIISVCKNNNSCSGSGSLEIKNSSQIPKGIPESTSGTYKITSVLTASSGSGASSRGNGAGLGYSSSSDTSYCSTTIKSRQSGSPINVRQGPDTNYPVQHYGYSGDVVDILNTQGNPDQFKSALDTQGFTWYQVGFQKSRAYGWVRQDFLTLPPVECRN